MNMVRSAPAAGSTEPGDLYIDLQSRQMWLGVDVAVDPAGSVLLSDIVALQDDIADSLVESKAYTDTQIVTRAPTVHTHTSAQITDFTSAVTGIVTAIPQIQFTRGMIMMWSGALSAIGVGDLAGWALCDGANSTPDLRDRFVLGAGVRVPGTKNPQASAVTDIKGGHTHTINGTTLTIAQIPAHAHGPGTLAGTISGTAAPNGAHAHGSGNGQNFLTQSTGAGGQGTSGSGFSQTSTTDTEPAHSHSVSGSCDVSSGATANNGSGGSHAHTASTTGDHSHVTTSAALRDALPFYALAFIMKL